MKSIVSEFMLAEIVYIDNDESCSFAVWLACAQWKPNLIAPYASSACAKFLNTSSIPLNFHSITLS